MHEGIQIRDTSSVKAGLQDLTCSHNSAVNVARRPRVGAPSLTLTSANGSVEQARSPADRWGNLLGKSPRMRELFADLERIAKADVTLLIEGETGTGKDLVAETVHRASQRADNPYVVFDCSAVAPTLAESELFGHERGAFTGAVSARPGVFEQASGGTLFLDELGELPKDMQPKLLRVLEKREVRRVGSKHTIPVDVRVIAATNRSLTAEVKLGNFRQDLYFRVAAAQVSVPALRERMEDLPMLVEHFLSLERPPRSLRDVPADALSTFAAYRWPGNVRELRNAVQRLLVTPERALHFAAPDVKGSTPPGAIEPLRVARRNASDTFEQDYLAAVLAKTSGNITRAAAIAEVSRQMLQKLMRKHGMGGESS